MFSATEAYLIENGKITPGQGRHPHRQRPRRTHPRRHVGNDMALDPGIGTCGKEGQSVPVGVGQPTLRIDG